MAGGPGHAAHVSLAVFFVQCVLIVYINKLVEFGRAKLGLLSVSEVERGLLGCRRHFRFPRIMARLESRWGEANKGDPYRRLLQPHNKSWSLCGLRKNLYDLMAPKRRKLHHDGLARAIKHYQDLWVVAERDNWTTEQRRKQLPSPGALCRTYMNGKCLSTLRRALARLKSGEDPHPALNGPKRLMTPTQEADLNKWCDLMLDSGHRLSKARIIEAAQAILRTSRRLERWWIGFNNRREQSGLRRLVGRVTNPKSMAKVNACQPSNLRSYFELLGSVFTRLRITDASQVMNLDECGCSKQEPSREYLSCRRLVLC